MHSKLQVEKTRLSLAIQACEAATACISRPNTPQDPIPHRVPESELNARSKLEDFLDQVPSVVFVRFVLIVLCPWFDCMLMIFANVRACATCEADARLG